MSMFRNMLMAKAVEQGGGDTEQWMIDAADRFAIDIIKIQTAYKKYGDIIKDALEGNAWHTYNQSGYFTTNIILEPGSTIEAKARLGTSAISSFMGLCGSKWNANIAMLFRNATTLWSTYGGVNFEHNISTSLVNDWHTYGLTPQIVYIDDKQKSHSIGAFQQAIPLTIGVEAGFLQQQYRFFGDINYVSIIKDGIVLHFYIPIDDNKLLDIVTDYVFNSTGSVNIERVSP